MTRRGRRWRGRGRGRGRRRGRSGIGLALVVALVVVAVSAGCGLRQDDKPHELAIDPKTKALLDNPVTTSTNPRASASDQRELYLVRSQAGASESLVPVRTAIPTPDDAGQLPRAVIERLVTSPPVTEDLKTFIPTGTRVLSVVQHDNVVDVDLSKEIAGVESTSQRLAVAQIVFTATSLEGIDYVRFSINGSPTPVPLDDKTSEVGAQISRDDFPKLRSGGTTTTPAPTDPATESSTEPAPVDPVATDPTATSSSTAAGTPTPASPR